MCQQLTLALRDVRVARCHLGQPIATHLLPLHQPADPSTCYLCISQPIHQHATSASAIGHSPATCTSATGHTPAYSASANGHSPTTSASACYFCIHQLLHQPTPASANGHSPATPASACGTQVMRGAPTPASIRALAVTALKDPMVPAATSEH